MDNGRRPNGGAWRPALFIALVYAVAGGLWVAFSDRLVADMAAGVETITLLQTYKGFLFIGLSTALVFVLVWLHSRRTKELELAVRQSESYYRTVINRAQEGFWRIDTDRRTVGVNDALCEMLGYRRSEMLGKTPFDFVDERNQRIFDEQLARAPHTSAVRDYEITLRNREGGPVPALFHATTLWNESGQPIGSYAFVTDIRHIKRVENTLQRSNRALLTLSGGNRAVLRAQDDSDLPTETCRVAVERGGYSGAWAGIFNGEDCRLRGGGYWGIGDDQARRIEQALREDRPGCPLHKAVESERIQLCSGSATDPVPDCLHEAGIVSGALAAIPLVHEEIHGLMVLFADEPFDFNHEEVTLLQELADDLAYGLATIRTHRREREHLERLRLAGTVFDSTAEGIVVTDPEERILSVNRAFTEITGYSEQEVLGKTPRILQSGSQNHDFYRNMWQGLKHYGQWHGEVWNRRKDGTVYPEWLTISAVHDGDTPTHYVGVFSDISRLKQSEEEIDFLVYHDPLTRLPNRLLFQERAEYALRRAEKAGYGVAICVLDLSGFRDINDSRGHTTGDEILKLTAERLEGALRGEDSVGRLGGDQFILLLDGIKRGEETASIAQKVLEQFEQPFDCGEEAFHLGASVGISLFPADARTVPELVQNADAAMHRAKTQGRGLFQFYSQELTAAASERLALENALRTGLEYDEFSLVYQPQVELASGRLTGVEALVRWDSREHGRIPPDRFIPLAEDSGLIEGVGERVLAKATRQVRAWHDAGFDLGCLSVNVSAHQLKGDGRFLKELRKALEGGGLTPRQFELELTEQALMTDIDRVSAELDALRDLGVGIAVDDFGTGYSSLSYLKHLPVTRLKIDKSFVDDVPGNPADEAIVRTVIGMGGNLGLGVIAEGVETAEQAEFLLAEGCDQAQGYYYSEPLTAEELAANYLRSSGAHGFDSRQHREHT